jgi:superfamily II DNA or RNA helicase
MENVTIACYASFHKYCNTKWDLLVFDEVPHIDTELRREVCRSVHGEFILALGAVVDEDERSALEEGYGPFVISTVSLSQGIQWGIIPKPLVCIIHLCLDDKKKTFWYKGNKITAKEKYSYLLNAVEDAKTVYQNNASETNRQKMLRAGNARKRFLGEVKQIAVQKLCEKLKENNRRYLCFCASIKQAVLLGKENAYTSKTPKCDKILDKFNAHEIDSLYAVSKLIEGQNLVDIERGIITQLGGTPRITVQMIGRVLRSKKPIIYIPVFDDTKDTSFLYTVTDNIPADCIKHYNSNSLF